MRFIERISTSADFYAARPNKLSTNELGVQKLERKSSAHTTMFQLLKLMMMCILYKVSS